MYQIESVKEEVNLMNPLNWAYVGDAVYEQYIRTYLVDSTNLKPHKLHIETIKFVKAKAQAEFLKEIEPILSEEEKEIVRRARNTKNHHLPKNSNVAEYMHSTAFEALIGYFHLTKQNERIDEILEVILNKKSEIG